MNWKIFALRFIGLIVLAAIGIALLYPLAFHALVLFKLIPEELMDKAFGHALMIKSAFTWMGAVIAGFAAIFLKGHWRYVLYLSPLYAPSVFAIVYTLLQ